MKMLKVEPSDAGQHLEPHASPTDGCLDTAAAHLVFSYLTQHCYADTAAAFMAQWLGVGGTHGAAEHKDVAGKQPISGDSFPVQTLEYRRHLRALLLDGRVADALHYLEEFFPQVISCDMQDGADDGCLSLSLRFRLLCQQFVEMVRAADSTAALDFTESTLAPMAHQRPRLLAHLQVRASLLCR